MLTGPSNDTLPRRRFQAKLGFLPQELAVVYERFVAGHKTEESRRESGRQIRGSQVWIRTPHSSARASQELSPDNALRLRSSVVHDAAWRSPPTIVDTASILSRRGTLRRAGTIPMTPPDRE